MLKVGDVVTIVDPQLPRALWPVGKVTQVFPSLDRRVRAVNIEVKGKTWPVARLIQFPALPENDWCEDTDPLWDEQIQYLNSGAAVQKAQATWYIRIGGCDMERQVEVRRDWAQKKCTDWKQFIILIHHALIHDLFFHPYHWVELLFECVVR